MATTGIARIDALWNDGAGPAITRDDGDVHAVGAVQDLLISHGARLPGILDASHGRFGPKTEEAVRSFQAEERIPVTGQVEQGTLQALARKPAASPIAANAYLTLVLDTPWTGFTRLVGLTAQFEAAGKFTARNRNTDRAGLSFGIIQWAQKPRRLNGLLRAFAAAQPERFVEVFGGGSRTLAEGLLAHTAKPQGGVDASGRTTDPRYDLVSDEWQARFIEAGRDHVWQRVQLQEATSAFRRSLADIRREAPVARSERGIAFLLDVANQHGDGGLRSICAACRSPDGDESTFLHAVHTESVRRVQAQFGDGSAEMRSTHDRRERFRTSGLLSDVEFEDR